MVDRQALVERLDSIRAQVADAARAASRDPEDITTIVVTKYHPLELVEALFEAGVRDFGENRHPESRDKAAHIHALGDGARLHFIGQLQRNKARQVGRYADAIHSIDRSELVQALATLEREGTEPLDVALQLSLDGDTSRGGVPLDQAVALAEEVAATPTLRLRGVMAVAPIGADTDAAFATVRETSERVRTVVPDADWISAGMSHDFRSAISQGATHLRIGTAITGNRPTAP
ncbi:YggS family pyridoxal phosphate-dependent enzyme [Gulosibacter macacae]|uniref:Pyridoxal phosphate homeostasis protein n=1 Tax=Gulosibacter macacae TaxID=2488791 RepID=A0A3P3VXD7_9MICO|nr:YggS family pyridoxal phosphate-dependent enzyme [Gulosibacter macacae]RRJ86276.1 YggS family pyridoxal phosphate-dependent enzyme [Gulosibacter macacae]